MWIVLVWIACMLLAGYIAGTKQRSAWWALLGLFFGPLGVLIVALLPQFPAPEPVTYVVNASGEREAVSGSTTCPFCAETIKAAAVVCKHCGRDLPSFKPEAVITDAMAERLANRK